MSGIRRDPRSIARPESTGDGPLLRRQLLSLAIPVMLEHLLHTVVGLTDVYLANHLPRDAASATAAVGTVAYFLWFVGLAASAVGTGGTAIIARAIGARHRRLANKVCGQSITMAVIAGVVVALVAGLFARPLMSAAGLQSLALDFGTQYLGLMAWALPLTIVMFVGASCLRGAGDTLSPAVTLAIVDGVNVVVSVVLCYGWFGFEAMGLRGIALGTAIAYAVGGCLVVGVLLVGRGGIRLHLHRLMPDVSTIRRILRIGLPNGVEQGIAWMANMVVVAVVNRLGVTSGAAHANAIRIESLSYMAGFAVAVAASTVVGQSLGMGLPDRARRGAFASYLLGGSIMTLGGVVFIVLGRQLAGLMSTDPAVAALTATCLLITGFIQPGFAAAAIFAGALRGAGDTLSVMLLNLASIVIVRMGGVLLVTQVMGMGLTAIWVVLCFELMVRGGLMVWRFLSGKWIHARV